MPTASFSSLYIGILAATTCPNLVRSLALVSVPFTSGSSLQLEWVGGKQQELKGFSSLYIGILAATRRRGHGAV